LQQKSAMRDGFAALSQLARILEAAQPLSASVAPEADIPDGEESAQKQVCV
jgi:hypothetical protein